MKGDKLELEQIEGIGPKTKELLEKIGIFTVDDLISHYPYRYEILKRSNLLEMKDGDRVVIDGIVEGQPTIIYLSPKLKKIILRINTNKTIVNVTIYNKVYLMDNLKSGNYITVIGRYDKIKNTIIANDIRLERLPVIPKIESIYYTTSGLSKKSISKFITSLIMNGYKPVDVLPEYIIQKYNFLSKYEAIAEVHNPTDTILLKKARQRLKYEELFMYLLKINYLKEKIRDDELAIERNIDREKIDKFIKKLPYEFTIDQTIVLKEILNDMDSKKRMNRLLQGDVGSGKTIVAFLASYANYLSGYQTALMVPTEILANQHYKEAKSLFEDEKMVIELLTSSTNKKDRERICEDLANGKIDLIIGTQSLIQEGIKYNNLGLVITDEQHRFGVNQRAEFKNKGISPDVLSMSATPIPRTYALTVYGDMEVSSIKTKPIGRLDVITYFKKEKDITSVLELMKNELDKGHQIYVIAPMIDTDNDEKESVSDLVDKMNRAFGKIAKIASVHGKMDTKEKNNVMKEYEKGKINILISTTVIEVGVNVPNASMIVIFDANLFGLSTIHQLRGRVGRSNIQSYCVLIAKEYQERLKMLESCNDGFLISEYDFKNRGEGDIFGVKQSGEIGLKLANVKRDFQMLLRAREDVLEFMPKLMNNHDEYKLIWDELEEIPDAD
ncbi:MAG: ATP-dependent DNA helicase RecG [Erysipelotrichaceae bacterium]|nr:ATP-dependent DNA helicase RecG [Erysipelotrichaceae bacterium]